MSFRVWGLGMNWSWGIPEERKAHCGGNPLRQHLKNHWTPLIVGIYAGESTHSLRNGFRKHAQLDILNSPAGEPFPHSDLPGRALKPQTPALGWFSYWSGLWGRESTVIQQKGPNPKDYFHIKGDSQK